MNDVNGPDDYISFIKGFSAAMDTPAYDGDAGSAGNGVDTGAYALGYAAAVDEREPRPRYLELSATAPMERARAEEDEIPEQGAFRGSLDLGAVTDRSTV
jgi:hypothetical protein